MRSSTIAVICAGATIAGFAQNTQGSSAHRPFDIGELAQFDSTDTTIDVAPAGRLLAVGHNGEVFVVDSRTGLVTNRLGEGTLATWAPDGDQLAFYSTRSGDLQLWSWHRRSGELRQISKFSGGIDPNPLTNAAGPLYHAFRFDWSPDARKIVFASRAHGSTALRDNAAIVRSEANADSLVRELTLASPSGASLEGVFAHAAGERSIHYSTDTRTMRTRPRFDAEDAYGHLFVLDVEDRTVRQITMDRKTYFDPRWSPDGRRVAAAVLDGEGISAGASATAIAIIDPSVCVSQVLVAGPTLKTSPKWNRDGTRIAYLQGQAVVSLKELAAVPVRGGKSTLLARAPRLEQGIWKFFWSGAHDGVDVVYGSTRDAAHLAQLRNGSLRDVMTAGTPWCVFVGRLGVAAWAENDRHGLPVVKVLRHDGQSSKTVMPLYEQSAPERMGAIKPVRWTSGRGEALEGVLLLPPATYAQPPFPVIVDVYPLLKDKFWFFPLFGNHAWASLGYAVFRPGAPAPHVWELPGGARAKGAAGWEVTLDEVMSGIDALIAQGLIDGKRMCLLGHSNGGGVVNYLVTRTDRFRCAISVSAALSNWVRAVQLENVDLLPVLLDGLAPERHMDELIALSAVFHLQTARTPLLLAVGDEDLSDFVLNQVEMYNGLRRLGREVTLLRYPDHGHIFTGEALNDFWKREVDFVRRYMPAVSPD